MLILKEENELLHIALIRSNAIGYDFKSSECKWSIFDDEIIVRMNSGRCYYFPITSVLYYYVESLEEEPKKEEKETKEMSEETVQDVIDSMNNEQKNVMYALIGKAVKDTKNGFI